MSQKNRIILGIVIIIIIIGGVLAVDQFQRKQQAAAIPDLPPGAIPIYVEGRLTAGFVPDDLEQLENASFLDDEEGKAQEGWLLRDILRLYLDDADLSPNSAIIVSSSSREKSIQLTWADVDEAGNMVMFDLSGRGTLKLVSKTLDNLDTRDEWIQEVDRIEVTP